MKIKAFAISAFTLFILAGISYSQSFNTLKLDSLLKLLEENNKTMGSLAFSKNGNILYTKAIGYSMITPQQKIAATEKTKYRIGSITKMFTATLIFQLIDDGKLDITTTLDKYFPTVPNANTITIGNMLNHHSGIHSFTDDSTYLKWMTEPKTHKEIIRIISASQPEFEPGSKAIYSNVNFILLGYIIEKIINKSYGEVLQEKICSKIGLNDTYYGGKTDVTKNESYSFKYTADWEQQSETDLNIPHGAGAIVSTPSDLIKFIDALFAGQLISETSLNNMKTITDGIGKGIYRFPYDQALYGHGGTIDGYNALLCYLPGEKLAVAFCSNGTNYSTNDIILGVLQIYFNRPYSLPVFSTYTVDPEELDKYLGVYSNTQIPLKITIAKNNGKMTGQATGQPAFPLEPAAEHVFKFDMAGIVIKFIPDKNQLLLEQSGRTFIYTKNK
jgi:CubicO group peptidase (beta-lactamase class C family)